MGEGQSLEQQSKQQLEDKNQEAGKQALSEEAFKVADAGQQNRATYGTVAPLANDAVNGNTSKNGAHDPFLIHKEEPQQNRAPYQPSGTTYPGHENIQPPPTDGNNATNNPQGFDPRNPPNFREHHADQMRDPNQRYETSDIGHQAKQELDAQSAKGGKGKKADHVPGMLPGEAWQFAWEGGDVFSPRVDHTIMRRGQKGILEDTTPGTDALFAGLGGISGPMLIRPWTRPVEPATAAGESKPGMMMRNFNPAYQNSGDLIKPNAEKHTKAFGEFDKLQGTLKEAAKGSDEAADLAKEKLEFIEKRAANFGAEQVADARAYLGGKAFSQAEIEILENRAAAGAAHQAAALKQEQKIMQMAENAPGWFKRAGQGIWGAMVSGGSVGLDRKASALGNDGKMRSPEETEKAQHESFNLSQVTAPLAFALAPKYKWAAAPAIGVLSSQIVDRGLGSVGIKAPDWWNAASGVYDGWNAFSTAASLAIAEHTPNPLAKTAVIGLGQGIPFLVHLAQDNTTGDLKGHTEEARQSVLEEHKERSYDSLRNVSGEMKNILKKKEDWVIDAADASYKALGSTANGGRWESLTLEQQLLGLRDDASISGAIADNITSRGTRIVDKTTEPTYVLDGLGLDVGGRGLKYMLRARDSAEKAAKLTDGIVRNNSDPNNEKIAILGTEPTAQEAEDLRKFSAEFSPKIQDLLDGKHDMRKALEEIAHEGKVIEKSDIKTFLKSADELALEFNEKGRKAREVAIQADQNGDSETLRRANEKTEEYAKIVAKLYRDEALTYLAWAKAKMANGDDGGGAYDLLIDDGFNRHDQFPNGQKKNYNGAQGALRIAEKYNPDNPDLKELGDIFSELTKEMVAKKQVQLTNSNINILGYHDDFRRQK